MFNERDFQRSHSRIFKLTGIMFIVMAIMSVVASAATIYLIYAGAKWLMAHS